MAREWHNREIVGEPRVTGGQHRHIYYNRGGYYRGADTVSARCHSNGSTVRLCFADWWEEGNQAFVTDVTTRSGERAQ